MTSSWSLNSLFRRKRAQDHDLVAQPDVLRSTVSFAATDGTDGVPSGSRVHKSGSARSTRSLEALPLLLQFRQARNYGSVFTYYHFLRSANLTVDKVTRHLCDARERGI